MMTPWMPLIWIHLLCMVGAFGSLLAVQLALPAPLQQDEALMRRITRLVSLLLLVGLLAGAVAYGLRQGHLLGGHFNGVIGLKFVLLLIAGGLLPLARRAAIGNTIRWIVLALLALAALAAQTI